MCFVRDYVEFHFDGPVLRAVADPFGLYGCQGWRFPDGNSPTVTRYYIGKTVDSCELVPDRRLTVGFGEHSFVIQLDEASRSPGPEAAHLIGADASGRRDIWIW